MIRLIGDSIVCGVSRASEHYNLGAVGPAGSALHGHHTSAEQRIADQVADSIRARIDGQRNRRMNATASQVAAEALSLSDGLVAGLDLGLGGGSGLLTIGYGSNDTNDFSWVRPVGRPLTTDYEHPTLQDIARVYRLARGLTTQDEPQARAESTLDRGRKLDL